MSIRFLRLAAEKPKPRLLAFAYHYTKPFLPLLIASIPFSTAIAFIEVYLFAFIGNLVDLLATADRATFWQTNGLQLALMGGLVLLVLPILNFISESISHQGLRGNFAMRIRWLAHRYVLRQSMDFFHNDFAGRVATKVMQAALGVRDAVMKITEVVVYVSVYFIGALVLVASSDVWLMVPLLVWLGGYALCCWYFVPRLGKLSEAQADMRSLVVGRVVDSYTNISTVKLFAHAEREDAYAREGMGWMLESVYKSMRMSTFMTSTLSLLERHSHFHDVRHFHLALARQRHNHRRHRLFHRPDAAPQGHVPMDHLGSGGPLRRYRRHSGQP